MMEYYVERPVRPTSLADGAEHVYRLRVSPEVAQALLNLGVTRKPRPNKLEQQCQDLINGDFRPGSVMKIAVREDGTELLVQGQHRCRAVIKTGVSMDVVMFDGTPVEDADVEDTNAPRSLGDVLSNLYQEPRANVLAAALYSLWRREKRDFYTNTTPSHSVALRLLKERPTLRDGIKPTSQAVRELHLPHGLSVALYYQMHGIDAEDCEDFWGKLGSGAELTENDPIFVLRRTLLRDINTPYRRINPTLMHAYLIKTWNAYREGLEVSIVRFTRGGKNRERFPELDGYVYATEDADTGPGVQ